MNRTVLTDEQWVTMWAFLAAHPRVYVGQPEACRRFLNAVLWVLRSGAQGRLLPAEWGRWNRVYSSASRAGPSAGSGGTCISTWPMTLTGRKSSWTAPLCGRTPVRQAKKSTPEAEALGRSRGGFSTKIHALTDALGNPLDFELTGGQAADITQAEGLLPEEPVVADKSYDADAFVATVRARGAAGVIPPRKHRQQPREYDRHVYQERHLIECFFGKIKHYRRIFSRFEKTARNYLAFLCFVATLVWLR